MEARSNQAWCVVPNRFNGPSTICSHGGDGCMTSPSKQRRLAASVATRTYSVVVLTATNGLGGTFRQTLSLPNVAARSNHVAVLLSIVPEDEVCDTVTIVLLGGSSTTNASASWTAARLMFSIRYCPTKRTPASVDDVTFAPLVVKCPALIASVSSSQFGVSNAVMVGENLVILYKGGLAFSEVGLGELRAVVRVPLSIAPPSKTPLTQFTYDFRSFFVIPLTLTKILVLEIVGHRLVSSEKRVLPFAFTSIHVLPTSQLIVFRTSTTLKVASYESFALSCHHHIFEEVSNCLFDDVAPIELWGSSCLLFDGTDVTLHPWKHAQPLKQKRTKTAATKISAVKRSVLCADVWYIIGTYVQDVKTLLSIQRCCLAGMMAIRTGDCITKTLRLRYGSHSPDHLVSLAVTEEALLSHRASLASSRVQFVAQDPNVANVLVVSHSGVAVISDSGNVFVVCTTSVKKASTRCLLLKAVKAITATVSLDGSQIAVLVSEKQGTRLYHWLWGQRGWSPSPTSTLLPSSISWISLGDDDTVCCTSMPDATMTIVSFLQSQSVVGQPSSVVPANTVYRHVPCLLTSMHCSGDTGTIVLASTRDTYVVENLHARGKMKVARVPAMRLKHIGYDMYDAGASSILMLLSKTTIELFSALSTGDGWRVAMQWTCPDAITIDTAVVLHDVVLVAVSNERQKVHEFFLVSVATSATIASVPIMFRCRSLLSTGIAHHGAILCADGCVIHLALDGAKLKFHKVLGTQDVVADRHRTSVVTRLRDASALGIVSWDGATLCTLPLVHYAL